MKKAVVAITFFDLVFMFLLSLSGSLGGIFGNIAYYLSFFIPVFLAYFYLKFEGDSEKPPAMLKLLPDGKSLCYTLPLVAPFISVVFLISFLTSLLLNLLGFSDSVDVSGNLFGVVVEHALLPAFLEEALFRFVPLILLLPYSKKNALVISSVMFAAVHCNLFQIPYALMAGFVLSMVALATGNVFSCVILHFLNNIASIAFMRCSGAPNFNLIFFLSLGVLCAASLCVIALRRKTYTEIFREIKKDKTTVEIATSTVIFVAATLVIGVVNLWAKL